MSRSLSEVLAHSAQIDVQAFEEALAIRQAESVLEYVKHHVERQLKAEKLPNVFIIGSAIHVPTGLWYLKDVSVHNRTGFSLTLHHVWMRFNGRVTEQTDLLGLQGHKIPGFHSSFKAPHEIEISGSFAHYEPRSETAPEFSIKAMVNVRMKIHDTLNTLDCLVKLT